MTATAAAPVRLDLRGTNTVLGVIVATTMVPGNSRPVPPPKPVTGIGRVDTGQVMVVPGLGFAPPPTVRPLTAFFRRPPFEPDHVERVHHRPVGGAREGHADGDRGVLEVHRGLRLRPAVRHPDGGLGRASPSRPSRWSWSSSTGSWRDRPPEA